MCIPRQASWYVHAFVTSRYDSCNSLLHGLPQIKIDRLQRVQNPAAQLVTGVRGRVHMKPVHRQLHWLPIARRIMFTILLLTFKAISWLEPWYIANMLTIYSSSRRLRSSTYYEDKLLTERSRQLHTDGDRAFFSAVAPKLLNGLPSNIRAIKSLQIIK